MPRTPYGAQIGFFLTPILKARAEIAARQAGLNLSDWFRHLIHSSTEPLDVSDNQEFPWLSTSTRTPRTRPNTLKKGAPQ